MIRTFRNVLWFLPALSLMIIVAGCTTSSGGVSVSGKVVLPAGVKVKDNDTINVVFYPQDETKNTFGSAQASPTDLSFSAKEVVPGKYYIQVSFQTYPGSPDQAARMSKFEPFNTQFKKENKKLQYEVTNEPNQSITIDLGKSTVTKG